MFEGKKTTKKQKRTRLFITAVIISSMFVVRLILIQNGVITTAQDLTDEELVTRISPWEVQITTPSGTGRGTVILVSTGKKSASDTVYLISTADVVRDFDKSSTVTFSDGKAYSGEQGNLDEESNIGIRRTYFIRKRRVQSSSGSLMTAPCRKGRSPREIQR